MGVVLNDEIKLFPPKFKENLQLLDEKMSTIGVYLDNFGGANEFLLIISVKMMMIMWLLLTKKKLSH